MPMTAEQAKAEIMAQSIRQIALQQKLAGLQQMFGSAALSGNAKTMDDIRAQCHDALDEFLDSSARSMSVVRSAAG